MIQIERAIISVFDKTEIVQLSKFLKENGIDLIEVGDYIRITCEHGS